MINNQTTELREKLTERGVDWLDESNGYADVTTFIANGAKWTVISKSYLNPEHDWMTLRAERITPEQAIAVTLGSEYHGYEQAAIEAWESIKAWNTRAELGSEPPYDELLRCLENDWHISASWDGLRKFWCIELTEEGVKLREVAHGTLTAEQVREAVMSADRWEKPMGNTGLTNTHLIIRDDGWQAIADELNAELDKGNNGECYLVHEGKKYHAELDFGFLGMMPITITVGGFRYLVEVPNGE